MMSLLIRKTSSILLKTMMTLIGSITLLMYQINVFATKVRREPAAVEPMKIVIDDDKWRLPCNRAPPRKHSEEKQKEIRKQVDALLELEVNKESQATEWSQIHLVPKRLLLRVILRNGAPPSTLFI